MYESIKLLIKRNNLLSPTKISANAWKNNSASTNWSCRRSSPFLNMILQTPPLAVLKARRKGCSALLNIDDSEGMIPVMRTPGARGDRIGWKCKRAKGLYILIIKYSKYQNGEDNMFYYWRNTSSKYVSSLRSPERRCLSFSIFFWVPPRTFLTSLIIEHNCAVSSVWRTKLCHNLNPSPSPFALTPSCKETIQSI